MESFCVITNNRKELAVIAAKETERFFTAHKKKVFQLTDTMSVKEREEILKASDCAVVLGGDGTMIQAADCLCGYNVPIFGINLGTLGFLTEAEYPQLEKALSLLLSGEYRIEERMMLSCMHEGKERVALNDVVISRSGFSRVIESRVYVNEEPAFSYLGDGIIIATPTGSTGYNLSAGGTVVKPDSQMILITPICPHSMNVRGLIVSATDVITVEIGEGKKLAAEEVCVTVDGQEAEILKTCERIQIKKAKEITKLVKRNDRSFYEILRTKLVH